MTKDKMLILFPGQKPFIGLQQIIGIKLYKSFPQSLLRYHEGGEQLRIQI
ncbi:hypothetical protein IQ277_22410 [Nostocales cyanobacterium LEGE 12452]|nr:hypothetical protein [Nostocales cyanobacterium LEGE 12452]